MCIITVIDVQPNILDIRDVRTVTNTNSLLGNMDGFGYYLFNDKFSKSGKDSIDYWRKHWDKFSRENSQDFNGIYHVRKSSVTYYSQDNKHIADDKAHPFIYNDIAVAHNGFLNFRFTHVNSDKYEKFINADLIDSQKFAIVLSKICEKGKVTFDNIKDALNMFGGAYALAIKGKLDNFVWLVKGKDRTLFDMSIYSGKNCVGKIINTTTFSQILLGESLPDIGYDYDIKELKDNTAYKYELGSFELKEEGQILQDSSYISKPTTPTVFGGKDKVIFEEVLTLMYKMDLVMSDLIILSEIIFKKPVFLLDKGEFDGFKDILSKLHEEATHSGRIQLWNEIIKTRKESIYKLYTDTQMQYPFFLNSKSELKDIYRKTRMEKNAHELSTLQ